MSTSLSLSNPWMLDQLSSPTSAARLSLHKHCSRNRGKSRDVGGRCSVRSRRWLFPADDSNLHSRMLEPGFSISFELSKKQGAALVTKYPTYREDIQRELFFEECARRHYDSWVAFAREGGHGKDVKPFIVTGVDMTRDFAMMAYSNNGVQLKSEFTASVPGIASVSASAWGRWRTEGLVHTNCGPQLCLPPAPTQTTDPTFSEVSHNEPVSDEYNQCVFVRYYTMRKRPLSVHKIYKVGLTRVSISSVDHDNEEPPLEVQNDSDNNPVILLGDDGDDRNLLTRIDPDSDAVYHNTISVRLRILLFIVSPHDRPSIGRKQRFRRNRGLYFPGKFTEHCRRCRVYLIFSVRTPMQILF